MALCLAGIARAELHIVRDDRAPLYVERTRQGTAYPGMVFDATPHPTYADYLQISINGQICTSPAKHFLSRRDVRIAIRQAKAVRAQDEKRHQTELAQREESLIRLLCASIQLDHDRCYYLPVDGHDRQGNPTIEYRPLVTHADARRIERQLENDLKTVRKSWEDQLDTMAAATDRHLAEMADLLEMEHHLARYAAAPATYLQDAYQATGDDVRVYLGDEVLKRIQRGDAVIGQPSFDRPEWLMIRVGNQVCGGHRQYFQSRWELELAGRRRLASIDANIARARRSIALIDAERQFLNQCLIDLKYNPAGAAQYVTVRQAEVTPGISPIFRFETNGPLHLNRTDAARTVKAFEKREILLQKQRDELYAQVKNLESTRIEVETEFERQAAELDKLLPEGKPDW